MKTTPSAEQFADYLDSLCESAKISISYAKTEDLQIAHYWNMGWSGGLEHPMMMFITNELKKRNALNYETDEEEV